MITFLFGIAVGLMVGFVIGAACMAVSVANKHAAIPTAPEMEVTSQ